MRYIYSIIIILFSIINLAQVVSEEKDDFVMPLAAIMTEPIYGEENAPDNIYYKYIRNNTSEGFLYYLSKTKDSLDNDVTIIFIIPVQGNDAIFLILDEDFNFIRQYSIIYNPHLLPYSKRNILYSPKYLIDHSDMAYLYDFFTKQLEFDYKLIYKDDLGELLDNVLPRDAMVGIDEFNRSDPKYIRKQK